MFGFKNPLTLMNRGTVGVTINGMTSHGASI